MKSPTFTSWRLFGIAIVSALFTVGYGGCASTPATDTPPTPPPPDFTLEVTLLAQPTRQDGARPPRSRRPARFVIETDWILRSYAGRVPVSHDTFPRETRQLNENEITAIWNDLRSAGLLDPDHPSIVGRAPTPADLKPSERILVITIVADDDRRTLALDPAGPAHSVFTRLADLAWMPE